MLTLSSQNKLRITAIVLMMVTGINALAAGYSFMVDPSGSGLGMTLSYIQDSPFPDFFIPGILLFFFNGVLNVFTVIVAMRKGKTYPLLTAIQGCILLGWIIIQLTMVESLHPLHLILGIIGAGLMIMGIMLMNHQQTDGRL